MSSSKPRRINEPSALELIEESVHLLRRTPPHWLALYYVGAGSWVLGLLFFWAYTTWFSPPPSVIAWAALGLTGLFALLKTTQAEFCARLLAHQLGSAPPAWTIRRRLRLAAVGLRTQSWGLFILPLAALLTLPFAWAYAFFQNATVLSGLETEDLLDQSWMQAKLWPRQNHLGLTGLSLLALAAFINLASAFFLFPWLANHLLGMKNFLGTSGWSMLNSTFFVSVTALAWLAVDPLVKAFYVLRIFYGRSRRTGEDLLGQLQWARRRSSAALLLLALLVAGPVAARLGAAEPGAPPPSRASVDPARLDRSIDTVLDQRDFQWRLRPISGAHPDETEAGPVERFFRAGFNILRQIGHSLKKGWDKFTDWLDGLWGKRKSRPETIKPAGGGAAWDTLRILLYLFLALAAGLIVTAILLMWRQARRATPITAAFPAGAAIQPDLRDENVQAGQLPLAGWLALAREKMNAGEWRLALRALYLASLAGLAAEGLVTLTKFKTNLDYERELQRRAFARAGRAADFARHRRAFEDVWYGQATAGEGEVRAWLSELERPSPS